MTTVDVPLPGDLTDDPAYRAHDALFRFEDALERLRTDAPQDRLARRALVLQLLTDGAAARDAGLLPSPLDEPLDTLFDRTFAVANTFAASEGAVWTKILRMVDFVSCMHREAGGRSGADVVCAFRARSPSIAKMLLPHVEMLTSIVRVSAKPKAGRPRKGETAGPSRDVLLSELRAALFGTRTSAASVGASRRKKTRADR